MCLRNAKLTNSTKTLVSAVLIVAGLSITVTFWFLLGSLITMTILLYQFILFVKRHTNTKPTKVKGGLMETCSSCNRLKREGSLYWIWYMNRWFCSSECVHSWINRLPK